MDSLEMVTCTVNDLHQISRALSKAGIDVNAIYFTKLTSVEGHIEWLVRVVTEAESHDFVHTLIELRRAGKLPSTDSQIRISSVNLDHVEAKRVLDYARQMKKLPLTIKGVLWQGLFIEYALVAEVEGLKQRAA